jgi:hypothetical protein
MILAATRIKAEHGREMHGKGDANGNSCPSRGPLRFRAQHDRRCVRFMPSYMRRRCPTGCLSASRRSGRIRQRPARQEDHRLSHVQGPASLRIAIWRTANISSLLHAERPERLVNAAGLGAVDQRQPGCFATLCLGKFLGCYHSAIGDAEPADDDQNVGAISPRHFNLAMPQRCFRGSEGS